MPTYPYRNDPNNPIYRSIPAQFSQTDVGSIIRLNTPQQVISKRRALCQLVFGTDTVPTEIRAELVRANHVDPNWVSFGVENRLDTLVHTMEHGIDSRMHYFHASDPSSKLAIYHQGHSGGSIRGRRLVRALLEAGFDVIALTMPLVEPNSTPLVNIDHLGLIRLDKHAWLGHLDRPLHYFLEPVAAAVSYALKRRDYEEIVIVGFSGGGWTATVYAAMDPRILRSYSIAGTIPMYLRSSIEGVYKGEIGDMEQHDAALLATANYLEMYILGALGEGRRQLQVMLQYDTSAATHGIKYRTFLKVVQDRLRSLGPGHFDVFLDPSSGRFHTITGDTTERIIEDLRISRPSGPD